LLDDVKVIEFDLKYVNEKKRNELGEGLRVDGRLVIPPAH
jgi:hypothetical protein